MYELKKQMPDTINKPLVSVIMATFNRGHLISQTIENILQQDYTPLELIIINDGSSDESQKILSSFENIPQIIVIDNIHNLGLQKSLNKGIQQAKGKYIARIDDHDRWIQKDKLSRQVAFLESQPEVGLVGTAYQINDQVIQNRLTDAAIRKQMLFRCPFCHVSVLIRQSVLNEVGGYDEALPYSEDWELWLRIGQKAQLANLEAVSTEVIEAKNSLSSHFIVKQLPLNYNIIKKHLKHYPRGTYAIFYHNFIQYFFKVAPINGKLHRMMQKVFKFFFLKHSQ